MQEGEIEVFRSLQREVQESLAQAVQTRDGAFGLERGPQILSERSERDVAPGARADLDEDHVETAPPSDERRRGARRSATPISLPIVVTVALATASSSLLDLDAASPAPRFRPARTAGRCARAS